MKCLLGDGIPPSGNPPSPAPTSRRRAPPVGPWGTAPHPPALAAEFGAGGGGGGGGGREKRRGEKRRGGERRGERAGILAEAVILSLSNSFSLQYSTNTNIAISGARIGELAVSFVLGFVAGIASNFASDEMRAHWATSSAAIVGTRPWLITCQVILVSLFIQAGLCFHQPSFEMGEKITEEQVANLLAILRTDASNDAKVHQINNIKSGIKQNNVPEACVSPLFEATRTSMTSQHAAIVNAGFSTLNHLLTRLSRQEPKCVVKEAGRTLPLVIEKMGDQKEKYRQLAAQCLTTFWKVAPMDVERLVKNAGLVGKNSRMKEASMSWVVQVKTPSNEDFADGFGSCNLDAPRKRHALQELRVNINGAAGGCRWHGQRYRQEFSDRTISVRLLPTS